MARFYAMTIVPTLFGETALLRNWRRIGTHGRLRFDTFATITEAAEAMQHLQGCKDRRGYRRPERSQLLR